MSAWRDETWPAALANKIILHQCNQFLWRECRLPLEDYLDWLEAQVSEES